MDKFFKENIEELMELISDGVHIIDNKGRTVYYNKFAAELDNINPEKAVGRHLLEIFPSLTAETSTLLQVIKTGQPILNHSQTFKNYIGGEITTRNSTIPITVGKKVLGAIEVSRDITQVVKLTQTVVNLQAELLKDSKSKNKAQGTNAVYTFADLLGTSAVMLQLKKNALSVSKSPSPVMVYGETGTGKELLVHAIHNASPRRESPFVAQNCAALPETLLEGILFGTVKGSFTGAENRLGLFELADGGTLFLDEINSMPIQLQAKLLRVLQDGNVRRVGDTKVTHVDVRVMAAINIEPKEALEKNLIREDLFYRLNVISLKMPALKNRYEDIPVLVNSFIKKYNGKLGRTVTHISPRVEHFFNSYPWPGNVRELEHAIEGAMNMTDEAMIDWQHLPYYLADIEKQYKIERKEHTIKPLKETLEKVELIMIKRAIKATNGNVTKTADLLGVPRQTLQYKLAKNQINVDAEKQAKL